MPANIRGAIVVRNGETVYEKYAAPYRPDDLRDLYSLAKSFTSAAVGIAEKEGLFSRNDPVFPLLGMTPPGENAKEMRVHHLMTMTAGYPTYGDLFRVSRIAGAWRDNVFRARIVNVETPYVDDAEIALTDRAIRMTVSRAPSIERLRPGGITLTGVLLV